MVSMVRKDSTAQGDPHRACENVVMPDFGAVSGAIASRNDITGHDRSQTLLLPGMDGYVGPENPVLFSRYCCEILEIGSQIGRTTTHADTTRKLTVWFTDHATAHATKFCTTRELSPRRMARATRANGATPANSL
jgi:hypothetical protein